MRDFFSRAGIDGFDAGAYVDRHAGDVGKLPNIGIAVSGGGHRAMLNGAGAMAAFDDRTDGAKAKGHLGGLLQSATYVSALSGGGWLVGSMWVNNFSS
jgi:lysophospholipase